MNYERVKEIMGMLYAITGNHGLYGFEAEVGFEWVEREPAGGERKRFVKVGQILLVVREVEEERQTRRESRASGLETRKSQNLLRQRTYSPSSVEEQLKERASAPAETADQSSTKIANRASTLGNGTKLDLGLPPLTPCTHMTLNPEDRTMILCLYNVHDWGRGKRGTPSEWTWWLIAHMERRLDTIGQGIGSSGVPRQIKTDVYYHEWRASFSFSAYFGEDGAVMVSKLQAQGILDVVELYLQGHGLMSYKCDVYAGKVGSSRIVARVRISVEKG